MSISVGSNSLIDSYKTQTNNSLSSNRAGGVSSSISGLSKDSSKEELTEAVKSFEQYFVESMLKELKGTFSTIGGSGSVASQYTDYYMDFAISDVAAKLVDEYGGRITEDFVAQIQRNYGITEQTSQEEDKAGEEAPKEAVSLYGPAPEAAAGMVSNPVIQNKLRISAPTGSDE